MDIEQFRKAGYQAIDRICDYFYSLESRPLVSAVQPRYLQKLIPDEPPEKGEDFQVIADDYQKHIIPGITHWQHPSFFAWFPTACTYESIIADMYASSVTSPGFSWSASPASAELDFIVLDWSAKLLGLSPAFYNTSGVGGGLIQHSASDVALTALIAARTRYTLKHPDTPHASLVMYTTTQTHALGKKTAQMLNLELRAIEVLAEDEYGLRGAAVRAALDEDRKAGKVPFALIVTVGTTSTGAVDRLDELRDIVCENPDLWIHVDAAWAGVTLSLPEFREKAQLDAINDIADSFCTNFHKWGLVNFDASLFWVRNRKHLTDAFDENRDITPLYLRSELSDAGVVVDARSWQIPLSRRFRSLKIWFVLRSYGAEGFRAHIRRGIDLSQLFVNLVKASPYVQLLTPPNFALAIFNVVVPSKSDLPSSVTANTLTAELYTRLCARDDMLMTRTKVNGTLGIRVAIGNATTKQKHVEGAFQVISEEAKLVLEPYL